MHLGCASSSPSLGTSFLSSKPFLLFHQAQKSHDNVNCFHFGLILAVYKEKVSFLIEDYAAFVLELMDYLID
jgi:hypothetical protein